VKRCPKCNTIYSDDTLAYCLSDGTPLQPNKSYDSEATLVGNIPPIVFSEMPASPHVSTPGQQVKEKRSPIAPLLLMLAAGVVIGLLITYILLRPATSTSSQPTQNQPGNSAMANTAQTKPRDAVTKPSPIKAPTPAASSTTSQDIRWFVVLGTFASDDRAGANARLDQIRSEGFRDARIVDTNSYSNFTPDRLAVVLGPFSEIEARRIGSQIRSVKPTIKPGW
jgi:hypothetical protein